MVGRHTTLFQPLQNNTGVNLLNSVDATSQEFLGQPKRKFNPIVLIQSEAKILAVLVKYRLRLLNPKNITWILNKVNAFRNTYETNEKILYSHTK